MFKDHIISKVFRNLNLDIKERTVALQNLFTQQDDDIHTKWIKDNKNLIVEDLLQWHLLFISKFDGNRLKIYPYNSPY